MRTPFCFFCFLIQINVKKNIEKTLSLRVQALEKGEKQRVYGSTLRQYLPNPISKFPVKFTFTYSIFVLLSTDKKAKTISLNVFKITKSKTTKGTLRP